MSEQINMRAEFQKLDHDQQIAYGWAYVCEKDGKPVIDHSQEFMDSEELEKAAHKFVSDSRVAGIMHMGKSIGGLIESMVFTKEKQEALGVDLGCVGWWVGFKVNDSDIWKRIKDGEFSMFSIGGRAKREGVTD